jgi:hypothetical protein
VVDGSDVGWFLIGDCHISDAESSSFTVTVSQLLIAYCLYATDMRGKGRKGKERKGNERKGK